MDQETKANIELNVDETTDDPFYSESNMQYLKKLREDIRSGKARFTKHDLIKYDDDD